MKILAVLIVLLSARVDAAPIYSNLGDDVILKDAPDIIEFLSLEPFRFGAFWAEGFDGQPIMSNQTQIFELAFDGVWYRATAVRPNPCLAWQVDADSHDFVGIGRLLAPEASCQPVQPVCLDCQTPVCEDCGPTQGVPVSEPWGLLGLAVAGWVMWSRVAEGTKALVS